jgi:hypothetical protein
MGVVAPVTADPVSDALSQRIPKRPTALALVAKASVEVITTATFTPEREVSFGEGVVDHLRHRTVNLSHYLAELFPSSEISDGVIVIVEQRGAPREELVLTRVMLEPVPEDDFGLAELKGTGMIARAGRDEVNAVVAISVFESVASVEMPVGPRAFSKMAHLEGMLPCPLLTKVSKPRPPAA